MSGRSIDGEYVCGYGEPIPVEGMPIDDLISHLEICKNECPDATCRIGVNPKCLLVKMGCKAIMLKLDGEW